MKNYGDLIWTDHVLSRLKQRGITQSDVTAVWRNPDSSRYNRSKGSWTYMRDFGDQKIGVVAKKNEKGEWVIISVWITD